MKRKSSKLLLFVTLLLAFVLSFGFIFANRNVTASADFSEKIENTSEEIVEEKLTEEKIYCNATLDDDFADDTVLVVLNKAATFTMETDYSLKSYSKNDFSIVGCESVTEITKSTCEVLNNQIVKAKSKSTLSVDEAIKSVGESEENQINTDNYRRIIKIKLKNKGKENVLKAIKLLEQREEILSAEPDYYFSLPEESVNVVEDETVITSNEINGVQYASSTFVPNDPRRLEQWGLDKINITELWKKTTGSKNVKVGIIDTGIQGNHPDLYDNVSYEHSYNFTMDNGDYNKYANPDDRMGHGTSVAGIIGAKGNNGIGITGVCWDVDLISLKVLAENEKESKASRITEAIDKASEIGIKLLNFGLEPLYYAETLNFTLSNYRGLFICSAGNRGVNIDGTKSYPAFLSSHQHIMAVAASNKNDEISTEVDWADGKGSNYGKVAVDLFAPGSYILTTYPTYYNSYVELSGSSCATAFVTGVAALMLSLYPDMSPGVIKQNIVMAASKKSSLSNLCKSGARLDAGGEFAVLSPAVVSKQGSEWKIRITNPTNSDLEIIYNSRLCWGDDAKNWTALTDIKVINVPSQGSCVVAVTTHGLADYFACSYIRNDRRYITYSTTLAVGNTLTSHFNDISAHKYDCIEIIGKDYTTWKIKITNKLGDRRKVVYNKLMCNLADARDWSSALQDKEEFYLANGASKIVEISENWFAAYIGISLYNDDEQVIYYANELDANTTMNVTKKVNPIYTYLKLENTGKNGSSWNIKVTNPTSSSMTIYYNSKMCNEGDAKNWTGLSDIKSVWLPANGSTTVSISTNWFATSIAVSYINSKGTRIISYANGLGTNGSINVMHNYK